MHYRVIVLSLIVILSFTSRCLAGKCSDECEIRCKDLKKSTSTHDECVVNCWSGCVNDCFKVCVKGCNNRETEKDCRDNCLFECSK